MVFILEWRLKINRALADSLFLPFFVIDYGRYEESFASTDYAFSLEISHHEDRPGTGGSAGSISQN